MAKKIHVNVVNNGLFIFSLFLVLLSTKLSAQVNTYNVQQLQITPAFAALPASPTSTLLAPTSGNIDNQVFPTTTTPLTLPFNFSFEGNTYNQIYISLNGFITFGRIS